MYFLRFRIGFEIGSCEQQLQNFQMLVRLCAIELRLLRTIAANCLALLDVLAFGGDRTFRLTAPSLLMRRLNFVGVPFVTGVMLRTVKNAL